jgi:hypothetical protein
MAGSISDMIMHSRSDLVTDRTPIERSHAVERKSLFKRNSDSDLSRCVEGLVF